MYKARWALAALVCVLVGAWGMQANGQVGKPKAPATLKDGLVNGTGYEEEAVERFLKALGPAVTEQLLAGRRVEMPGLGTFQVVRVDAYRDLGPGGRPITVPARNYVEFIPSEGMDKVANQPGAVPAREVGAFDFIVNPGATPGIRTEGIKTIRTRPR